MTEQIVLNEKKFEEIEKRLLSQVMNISKSMIELFKFRMIYETKITSEQNQKTLKSLQDFRVNNWNKSAGRKEAYKEYVDLYN